MTEHLRPLIESVVEGEPGSQRYLVDYLRSASLEDWLTAADHDVPAVRGCAAVSMVGRAADGPLLAKGLVLASDDDLGVRTSLATSLAAPGDWAPRAVFVERLLRDPRPEVRLRAIDGAGGNPVVAGRLITMVRHDPEMSVRLAAAVCLEELARPADLVELVGLVADLDLPAAESDNHLMWSILGAIDRAVADGPGDEAPLSVERSLLTYVHETYIRVVPGADHLPHLARYLKTHGYELPGSAASGPSQPGDGPQPSQARRSVVPPPDPGLDLTDFVGNDDRLPTLHRDDIVERLVNLVAGSGAEGGASVVLLGPSGIGKTAIVHEATFRLAERGVRVFELSGYDIMVGTRYLGEWETRLDRIITSVVDRNGILFIPGFDQLISTGRSTDSDRNVAEMLAPRIERGEIVVVGETTSEAYARTIGRHPHLERLFTLVDVPTLSRAETADVVEQAAASMQLSLPADVMERLLDLSDDYLQRFENPDRALRLLRGSAAATGEVTEASMLGHLHESTGIPIDFLDESRPLDRQALRNQLQDQVMGQPEAIDAVVDVVMLIKASLTDPDRPSGVLLFVGPTGVGKTELARSLGSLLFGDPSRLVRFDMSEYATFEAFERLIGTGRSATADLTDAVREKPFSVILMDEIEKAHPNVYDLCLQLFDEGRLTDGLGRAADFHNSIIIMTSNIGAAFTGGGIGFVTKSGAPDESEIQRALERHFRPEFLNRIDRIVPFRPLDLEIAERIARREIQRGLDRKGLQRRDITVDVDASLTALLLKEGYSPEYGARPLRRAVERVVLGPLADEIAAGRAGSNAILRLSARNERLVVRRVEERGKGSHAQPESTELEPLLTRYDSIKAAAAGYQAEKVDLLEESGRPGFWDSRERASRVLDRIHRLDRVLSDVRRLGRDIERTERNPDPIRRASFVASHHREATRLEFLLAAGDLSDAFLILTSIRRRGEPLEAVELLAGMYVGLARRRHLEVDLFDDRVATEERTATLLIGGAGAFALLRSEAGLHRFTRSERAGDRHDVELVRVDVVRAPPASGFSRGEVNVDAAPVAEVRWRIEEGDSAIEVHAFHEGSLRGVALRSSVSKDEGIERAELMLRALVEHRQAEVSDRVVRRYTFGRDSLVKDLRSGRSTGRVRDVLGGAIEEFILSDADHDPGGPSGR